MYTRGPAVLACILDSYAVLYHIINSWGEHEYTGTWEGHRRLCCGWGARLPLKVECHPPAQVP